MTGKCFHYGMKLIVAWTPRREARKAEHNLIMRQQMEPVLFY